MTTYKACISVSEFIEISNPIEAIDYCIILYCSSSDVYSLDITEGNKLLTNYCSWSNGFNEELPTIILVSLSANLWSPYLGS